MNTSNSEKTSHSYNSPNYDNYLTAEMISPDQPSTSSIPSQDHHTIYTQMNSSVESLKKRLTLSSSIDSSKGKKTQFFHSELLNNYEFTCDHLTADKLTDKSIHPQCLHYNQKSLINSSLLSRFNTKINIDEEEEGIPNNKIPGSDINSNLSFRVFKSLENSVDLHVSTSDLVHRKYIMDGYLNHIMNYTLNAREVIFVNTLLSKVINLDLNKTHEIVNQELFLNKDVEELKQYYINYLRNCSMERNEGKEINEQKGLKLKPKLAQRTGGVNTNSSTGIGNDIGTSTGQVFFENTLFHHKHLVELLGPFKERIEEYGYNGDSKLLLENKEIVNTLLSKVINLDLNKTHEIVNQELFLNKDVEELKQYYINYLRNCSMERNEGKEINEQKGMKLKPKLAQRTGGNNNVSTGNGTGTSTSKAFYENTFFHHKHLVELLGPFKEQIEEYGYNGDSKLLLENKESIQKLNTEIIKHIQSHRASVEETIKDQGFTRPRIMILLPSKKHCMLIVNELINIFSSKGWSSGVGKKKKFREEFTEEKGLEDYFMLGVGVETKTAFSAADSKGTNTKIHQKTIDNEEDIQGVGIAKVESQFQSHTTRNIELFTAFAESDIIIASPLALKQSKIDKSLFSSIEILLVDFAETFLYQNLEYLEELSEDLNLFPKTSTNISDIYRIKDNYKEEFHKEETRTKTMTTQVKTQKQKYSLLKNLRQNIFVSNIKSMELESIFMLFSGENPSGKITMKKKPEGIIDSIERNSELVVKTTDSEEKTGSKRRKVKEYYYSIKFEFKFLTTPVLSEMHETKFNFFIKNLYQNLYEAFDRHTVIFCGNSFDFLRLKKHFKVNYSSVTYMSEEMEKPELQKNRFKFEIGQSKFLLYSERAHYFRKVNLRIVKNIVFYSLPEDPEIFKELTEIANPSNYKEKMERFRIEDKNNNQENDSAVICLVQKKLEQYQLESVLGYDQVQKVMKENSNNYIC
eukprot:CAMPEP_0170536382 /NCGR_PEP_ID=MMETSP0209-20121228/102118_1 /TAXON_ID=665100 ORGANISM="Litonotus pictus, Strain P1" /NCGR_SAMPLE_ID=MMETSP0209 /ASSEMBLY_ACC=CAM_ASM_000301 /LENGTH=972 /DNA_ID=CAMNT_0010837743 /DNA_START=483 /DNA_END=3401 /DNA_ORIENTATION=-